MTKEYLTVKEVSTLLQMHWQTILNYIKSGDIEAIHLKKGYRVSHESLARFVARRATKAKEK